MQNLFVFGIKIDNYSMLEAIDQIRYFITHESNKTHAIYIANAHTLNLVYEDLFYRNVIASAVRVFADGTGMRWAARMRGIMLKDNLVGTDLIPRLFSQSANSGYRYFLLGGTEETITRAAEYSVRVHKGWNLAGFHHGYLDGNNIDRVIEMINASKADLLLVGMGNPKQEIWIQNHQNDLQVPVCIGVGGLFDHWGGNLKRAPVWVRRMGYEWVQLLLQQPHKWKRYLLGNPKFLFRITTTLSSDRKLTYK